MSDFVHLHTHTEYSVLDGINRVAQLPEYVKSIGQKACAITDHGNVSGSYAFYKSCKAANIQPIIGMEAYYCVNDRTAKEPDADGKNYYHLILLAQNNVGLKNLFKLSTKAYTEGMYYKPRMDDELLAEHSEGIIATSACLGSRTSQLILQNRSLEAAKLLDHHASIFKDRFFIEVQLHEDSEQQDVNATLLKIASNHNWPLLLTNDCHYTHTEDKSLHEKALCMQTNDVMSNENRFSFGPIDVHVATHDWMATKAEAQSIPYEAIKNSVEIAKIIDSDTYFSDTMNKYPKFPNVREGFTSIDELTYKCELTLVIMFDGDAPQVYIDRLAKELKVIKKMGFSDYLLIVKDFLDGSRERGAWVGPGRGSAAGSLIAYLLGITQIDPIKYGLMFERFLNYGRAARPLIF